MEDDFSEREDGGKTLREYVSALRRQRWLILAVTLVFAPIAIVVAIVLPPVYRSTARILVQEQEVPPDLVRSTITSFADERIQVISNQVMTRAQLLTLVDKFDLYAKVRQRLTEDELIERMRKDIKLFTVNADVSDRLSGRRVNATIAFTISYDSPQPERAQGVVNELVSLYMNENVKVRQQSVAETSAFLTQEADRLSRQIQAIETKLAEFKRRNVGRMPESSAINIQLAERTEAELQRVERDMGMLQGRKSSLEAQLAVVSHTTPASATNTAQDRSLPPEDRLRILQAQYGADHPDVRRVQREIAALKAGTGTASTGDAAQQRQKLEEAKATTVPKGGDKRPAVDPLQRPDNPAYVLLASQVESTQRELEHLSAVRDDLRAKQRTYDARLLQIPEVEREYSELTRDYANAQKRYTEIKTKQMQAEGAVELERELKGERFSVGEPANLPQTPFSPNRPVLAVGGVVASLGGGLVLALLREGFDPSVKGPLELARIAPVPVLTAIPYIETRRERLGKRRRALVLLLLALLLAIAFLLGVHLFVKPLPELFESILRKILTTGNG